MSDSLPTTSNDPPPPVQNGVDLDTLSQHNPLTPASQDVSIPGDSGKVNFRPMVQTEEEKVKDAFVIPDSANTTPLKANTVDIPSKFAAKVEEQPAKSAPQLVVEEQPSKTPDPKPMQAPDITLQQPEPPAEIPTNPVSEVPLTTDGDSSKRDNFIILIAVLIALVILIWTWVAYLYVTNKQIESQLPSNTNTYTPPALEAKLPTATPTQAIPKVTYSVNNGHIASTNSDSQTTTIVNKNDYPETGDLGFEAARLSPDETMICAYSSEEAVPQGVYIFDTDGEELAVVGTSRKDCVWAPDSGSIAYLDSDSEGVQINLYIYNIENEEETLLTDGTSLEGFFRIYSDPVWDTDGENITVSYTEYDETGALEPVAGLSEVNIITGEIEEKI